MHKRNDSAKYRFGFKGVFSIKFKHKTSVVFLHVFMRMRMAALIHASFIVYTAEFAYAGTCVFILLVCANNKAAACGLL